MTDTPDTSATEEQPAAPEHTDEQQDAMLKAIYAAIAGKPTIKVATTLFALLFAIAADPETDDKTREALGLGAMDVAANIRRIAGLTDERVAEIMATSSSEIVEVGVAVDEP